MGPHGREFARRTSPAIGWRADDVDAPSFSVQSAGLLIRLESGKAARAAAPITGVLESLSRYYIYCWLRALSPDSYKIASLALRVVVSPCCAIGVGKFRSLSH